MAIPRRYIKDCCDAETELPNQGDQMPVQIVEILRRSVQGSTRPFYCRGDDGNAYFVKGRGAGKRSLIIEYVCGKLAKAFGLPIADFEIVEVPSELIDGISSYEHELGAGIAFASKAVQYPQDFNYSLLNHVDVKLRCDILVFDWWIQNADRTLTEIGGNPNLLWDQEKKQIVVIDHNLAFDADFDSHVFAQYHVFKRDLSIVFSDLVERENYEDRLSHALSEFELACASVPSEWWEVDFEVPTDFSPDEAKSMLERITNNNFWKIAT